MAYYLLSMDSLLGNLLTGTLNINLTIQTG